MTAQVTHSVSYFGKYSLKKSLLTTTFPVNHFTWILLLGFSLIKLFANTFSNKRLEIPNVVVNKRAKCPSDPGTVVPMIPALAALIESCWHPLPAQRPKMLDVLSKLEDIMVESQIHFESGRTFWKQFSKVNFHPFPTHLLKHGHATSVSWIEFVGALSTTTQFPESQLTLLNPLFSGVEISMDRLGIIMSIFGDFISHAHILSEVIFHVLLVSCSKMLELAQEIKEPSQAWFMPNISKDKACLLLAGRENNTFLVRPSLTDPAVEPFTLSSVRKKVIHRRFLHPFFEST